MNPPPPSARALAQRLLPIGIIVAVWAVFFWRILTPVEADRLTFQRGDFTLQFLAYRQLAYRQMAEGRFPVFEECLYSGYPFLADPQAQALYPPVLGMMLLGRALGWPAYPLRALEWEVMAHALLAAFGMFALLRELKLRPVPAVFGSLAFAFGGFMTGYAMLQTAILETAAWLPLILLAARRLALASEWVSRAALLAALVALAYTAGHPQTLLFTAYAGGAAFVYWAWRARLSARHTLLRGAVAAGLAIGLSAAQLIPTLSFMLASTRASLPFDKAAGGFALQDIALFALTGVINVWQPLYAGIVTLLLAGVALRMWRASHRRHDTGLWLGLGLSALALSFGANALGFDLAYHIAPGYRQFQSQERHALIVSFSLSVLGAIGLQMLLGPARLRLRARLRRLAPLMAGLGGAAFVALIALHVIARSVSPQPEWGPIFNSLAMMAIMLLAAAGLFAWRARLGRAPRWMWGLAALAALVFDVVSVNRYTATQKPADPFPPLALLQPIQQAGAGEFFRIYNHYGLPLNAACVNGLREIGGGSPIALRHYQDFLRRAPEDVYSRLLNVRYTATWRGGMGTDQGRHIPAQKLATDQFQNIESNLFRLEWPEPGLKPVWIPRTISTAQDETALFNRLAADDFDPYAEAVVYAPASGSREALRGAPGSAGLEGRATGYLKASAWTEAPGLLVFSEAWHWNWIALVNGVETQPVMANGALLAVPVPAGASTVEMSYRPTDFYAGLGISAVTAPGLAMAVYLSRRRPPSR